MLILIVMSNGLAISGDEGEHFREYGQDSPVMTANHNGAFLVGDPFVQHLKGAFHMWHIFDTGWKRYSPEVLQIIADRLEPDESQALPMAFQAGGLHHIYFCYRSAYDFRLNKDNINRLGYAYSDGLIHWHRDDSQSGIDLTESAWDSDIMCCPNTFECDGVVCLLYNGNEFSRHNFGLTKLIGM